MKHLPKDSLKWVAAAFALVATATAEYEIARAIGMHAVVAASVPGALDAYVVRALRAHREVLTAVLAMVAVNAASHLVTAGVLVVDWPLITAVSAIAPLVLWRVHALGTPGEARRNLIWTGTLEGHTTSTEPDPEHGRAPDNPEPPGTREHPEHIACTQCGGLFLSVLDLEAHQGIARHGVVHGASTEPVTCYCGAEVWGDLGAHQRAPWHGVVHGASTPDLDVPDWVNPPSTPTVPVHAPYADHVDIGTPGVLDLSEARARWQSADMADRKTEALADHDRRFPLCPACQHNMHTALACDAAFCDCVHHLPDPGELDDRDGVTGYTAEHAPDPEDWTDPDREHTEDTASTEEDDTVHTCPERWASDGCTCFDASTARTADDWNLEHVSTGVLEPDDTVHMERARELFHTIGGVPPFRALKEGTPGMGTPRAQRIRAALKIEAEGTE